MTEKVAAALADIVNSAREEKLLQYISYSKSAASRHQATHKRRYGQPRTNTEGFKQYCEILMQYCAWPPFTGDSTVNQCLCVSQRSSAVSAGSR